MEFEELNSMGPAGDFGCLLSAMPLLSQTKNEDI